MKLFNRQKCLRCGDTKLNSDYHKGRKIISCRTCGYKWFEDTGECIVKREKVKPPEWYSG